MFLSVVLIGHKGREARPEVANPSKHRRKSDYNLTARSEESFSKSRKFFSFISLIICMEKLHLSLWRIIKACRRDNGVMLNSSSGNSKSLIPTISFGVQVRNTAPNSPQFNLVEFSVDEFPDFFWRRAV